MVKLSLKNPYIADTCIADTIFWHHVKSSSQIYLFIADNPFFCVKLRINLSGSKVIPTHNHLVRKPTLNHLGKLAKDIQLKTTYS